MIYVKNPKLTSLSDFIKSLKLYPSITQSKFVKTFKDPECTEEQCQSASRSINAIVEIVQTYFPDETLSSVLKALQKEPITMIRCPDIQKFVFYFNPAETNFLENFCARRDNSVGCISSLLVSDSYIDDDGYSIPVIKSLLEDVT